MHFWWNSSKILANWNFYFVHHSITFPLFSFIRFVMVLAIQWPSFELNSVKQLQPTLHLSGLSYKALLLITISFLFSFSSISKKEWILSNIKKQFTINQIMALYLEDLMIFGLRIDVIQINIVVPIFPLLIIPPKIIKIISRVMLCSAGISTDTTLRWSSMKSLLLLGEWYH